MEEGGMDDNASEDGGVENNGAAERIEECLVYFRQAIASPLSVAPWSEWWRENEPLVEQIFPLMEYVRLKHRKLLGARQILQRGGELPKDYAPPSPRLTGSCGSCGERVTNGVARTKDNALTCPHCGATFSDPEEPGPPAST